MRHYTTYLICILNLFFATKIHATDVYVGDIVNAKEATSSLKNIINVSNKEGYDNQPYFAPNGSGLYYTSMRPLSADKGQTDALFYNFKTGKKHNITRTDSVSEYSPTEMKGGEYISFIHQDANNKQWIYKANIKTGKQSIINPHVEPVGYHAWGSDNDFALFVLGEVMTLQYFPDSNKNERVIVADNIGRSIRFNPKYKLFTFTQGTDQQVLSTYHPAGNKSQQLLPLPGNSVYYTWFDDESVISADKTTIMKWHYNAKGSGSWKPWLDLSHACSTQITRLAVNNAQSKLAFVCDEK